MARGGKREGAGRKAGAVSQAKRDLADMAKDHAAEALEVLVAIAKRGESESARVSAANAILDRAYGKPPQAMDHTSSDGSMKPPTLIQIVPVASNNDHSPTKVT